MNKPVHLDLLILEICKIRVLVWLRKTKIERKSKHKLHRFGLLYSLYKKEYIASDVAKDAENRFNTSN